MPHEKMSKPKSMGPISVLGLCSPLLLLAEVEAEGKAKAPRLRAQQRGRVATRKEGRVRAALRYLRRKIRPPKTDSTGFPLYPEFRGPYPRRSVHRAAPARRPERKGESRDSLRPMPPEEKKG